MVALRQVEPERLWNAVGYNPHALQREFHGSGARFKVLCAGRRAGKSQAAARELEPHLFTRGQRKYYWILGPTYPLGEKEFRVLWDDLIIGKKLGEDKRVKKSYSIKQGNMFIELPWGVRVEVKSSDQPASLVGEGLDGVIFSEAAKHAPNIWPQYIQPALADRLGFTIFPSTPEGRNWFREVWLHGQDPAMGEYASWRAPSWVNPYVYPGGEHDPEIELLRRTLSREEFLQEIAAEFTAFVGKVFPAFDRSTHVAPVSYDPLLPNYIGFDFGWTAPFAAIEFQVTPTDEIRVWREYYQPYRTVPEHVAALRGRVQPEGYRIALGFGDAADPEAVAYLSANFCPVAADPEAKKNWRAGVDMVNRFLDLREVGVDEYDRPRMRPGLVVDPSCTNFINEMETYRAAGHDKPQQLAKDAPKKQDDHGVDAMRYALMHLYELGVSMHLEDVMVPGPAREKLVVPSPMVAGEEPSVFAGQYSFFGGEMDF